MFFEDTVHLTPRGHQILADALAQFLRDSHLVSTPRSSPVVNTGR
jgi:phospholipase/lecithinase/hemolysin